MSIPISIITPALNSAGTIGRTLDSVAAQGVNECEHIIVDGGSSDQTVEIVRRYSKARIVAGGRDGPYAAMNSGIRDAGGNIIAILNH